MTRDSDIWGDLEEEGHHWGNKFSEIRRFHFDIQHRTSLGVTYHLASGFAPLNQLFNRLTHLHINHVLNDSKLPCD